jgi:single-strand DNA-binding protein
MASFNKVLLMGNLTRDPELRYTQGGSALVKFGLAVNRKYKGKSGELVEEVTFVDIEGWGASAETFNQYMRKGRGVFIEGRLRLDSWQDKDGQKKSKLVVVMETFQFLGAGGAGGPGGGRGPEGGREGKPAPAEAGGGEVAERAPGGAKPEGGAKGEEYDFEDIPF